MKYTVYILLNLFFGLTLFAQDQMDTFDLDFPVLNSKAERLYLKIPLLKINPSIDQELNKILSVCGEKQKESISCFEFTSTKDSSNYFIAIGMTSYIGNMDSILWTGVFFIDGIPFLCQTSCFNQEVYDKYPSSDSIVITYRKGIEEDTYSEILLSSISGEVTHGTGFFQTKHKSIKYYIDICNNFSEQNRKNRRRK